MSNAVMARERVMGLIYETVRMMQGDAGGVACQFADINRRFNRRWMSLGEVETLLGALRADPRFHVIYDANRRAYRVGDASTLAQQRAQLDAIFATMDDDNAAPTK